jgi:hypothetical protein
VGSYDAAGVPCPEIEDVRGLSISSWMVQISEGKKLEDDRGSWGHKRTAPI